MIMKLDFICLFTVIVNIAKRGFYEQRIYGVASYYAYKGMVVGIIPKDMKLLNVGQCLRDRLLGFQGILAYQLPSVMMSV